MVERVGVLETIVRYPVKSMAGEEVDEGFVGFCGLMGDRVFAFVRDDGAKGFPWHTCREQEDLVLYRPSFVGGDEPLTPIELQASLNMAPGVNPVYPDAAAFGIDVTTPDGEALRIDSAALHHELRQRSGASLSLRFSERSLYDCRPISIFGNNTAVGLSQSLEKNIDRRRFRANFYVDWDNKSPFHENEYVGRTLVIGERVRVSILERDPRCKVITIDPETSETSPALLRYVTASHGGTAGVYGAVLAEGMVRRGDLIRLE